MDFDYRSASFWLAVAQWVTQGIVMVWVYLRTKDTDNQRAVKGLAEKLQKHIGDAATANEMQNNRLTTLEATVSHMPTDEEIARLTGEVATVKAQVDGVALLLARVERQTQLIHEHLLTVKR